jgi:SAM-dependent methyltransferase
VPTEPAWLRRLLRPGAVLPGEDADAPSAGRFEGLYGPLYDRVIQSDVLRRLAPLVYGDAGPVVDLDGLAWRVADGTRAGGRRTPVLLDVPSGGGTLLPRLEREGYRGRVVESDLGARMLERAAAMAEGVTRLDVALLRADAHDLPLRDATVDGAVSLNGLHVMPDPRTFLRELGRVVRPGGTLWIVTLVSGGNRRGDAVNRLGALSGILPGPPPARPTLRRWLREAGFTELESLGGEALVGFAATKPR